MSYTESCNFLAEVSVARVPVAHKQALSYVKNKLVGFGTLLGSKTQAQRALFVHPRPSLKHPPACHYI